MKLKYRDLQIIKHALQQYIQRENPQEGDLIQEENLLKKVEEEIAWFKENIEVTFSHYSLSKAVTITEVSKHMFGYLNGDRYEQANQKEES